MRKIKVNSKIYAQAHKEKWLNSLAIYVYICKKTDNKRFYYKPNQRIKAIKSISIKLGIGFSALNKHLNILKGELPTHAKGDGMGFKGQHFNHR